MATSNAKPQTPGRRLTRLAAAFAVVVPTVCAAQTNGPIMPPGHGGQHMTSASGMPLLDSTLPAGTLTIRVVRGAFVEDLVGQEVTIEVRGGRTETSRTGPAGRIQIAHLPIDADLRAIAVVGDQRVESEVFQMPADGGVRMLLVASSTADQTAAVSKAGLPSALLAVSGLRAGPLSPPAERKADGGLEAIGMGLVLAISALLFAAGCWRARGRPNRRHFEG